MKRRLGLLMTVALVLMLAIPLALTAMAHDGGIWPSSTYLTMTASATEVNAGDTVTLTITEVNDGAHESPWSDLSPVWVEVFVNGGLVMTLDQNSPEFLGTDIDGDGIMVPDEVWQWQIQLVVNADVTIEAVGHGIDAGGWDKTPPKDTDEYDAVRMTVTPNGGGGEGCTPGYWRNHLGDWPATGYSTGDGFDTVFGVTSSYGWTLGEAINARGGGERALMRHATAALLSAAHPGVEYDLSEAEVIALVQDAYASVLSFNSAKNILADLNEQGCNING